MKSILLSLILLCSFLIVHAQWNGTNPLWTNSNVGIGTSTISDKLHIAGSGDVGIMLDDNYDTNGSPWRLWVDNWDISASKNFTFKIDYSNLNIFNLTTDGKVGIGTTNPNSTLSVGGTGQSRAAIYGEALGAASTYDIGLWAIGTSYGVFSNQTGGAMGVYGGSDTGIGGYFKSTSGYGLIVASGNVGIGTTTPSSATLQVNGTALINSYVYIYGSNKTGVIRNAVNDGILQLSGGNTTSDGANIHLGGSAGDNSMFVRIGSSEKFRITSEGNVGIGTSLSSNPNNYKLAVKGKIGCSEIKVEDVSTWSDFVFGSGYRLRTLSEVENYIKANKHLPDVPSEEQVKTEGYDVTEMNALLLQKIEELTLYAIGQDKALKEQKTENKKLEDRIEKLETLINLLTK